MSFMLWQQSSHMHVLIKTAIFYSEVTKLNTQTSLYHTDANVQHKIKWMSALQLTTFLP